MLIIAKEVLRAYEKIVILKNTQPKYKFYRYELENLDTILGIIEIELGIRKHQNCCHVYKQLDKLALKKHELTKAIRERINQLCEGASTEYVYCKTLLESRYNWKIQKDNYGEAEYDDRRTALNIRNSIRYIETAKYRYSNTQTKSTHSMLVNADRLSKKAKVISIIGAVISFISLIIALNSCTNSTSTGIESSAIVKCKCSTELQDCMFNYRCERRRD